MDVNRKIKLKRETGRIVFDDAIEVISLTKDNKKLLETNQQ
jgi:phosphorylcholine metabolism protein LicD